VWDLPTRLFHWLLAGLIVFSWWSHEDHLPWHRLSGYGIAALLVFRIWWGVAGSSTARFAGFLKGPRAIASYLKGGAAHSKGSAPGHNPLGGWSVAAMLLVLLAQVGLGLFSVDQDGFEAGPFSKFISYDTGRTLAGLHEALFKVLVGLIVLHLLAIGWYAARKTNLVGPMITGRGVLAEGATAPVMAPAWRLVVGLVLAAATFGGLYWLEKAGSSF
jgi:cytochrome b